MSLKAGGVGLNLTAASNVFLMVNSQDSFGSFFFLKNIQNNLFPFFPPYLYLIICCRIHGGILLLKSKQSCESIVLGKSEQCALEDSLLRYNFYSFIFRFKLSRIDPSFPNHGVGLAFGGGGQSLNFFF
jgi:hypothetical protein